MDDGVFYEDMRKERVSKTLQMEKEGGPKESLEFGSE